MTKSGGGALRAGDKTGSAESLRLIGHHDLAGRGDGMQVLREGDVLYVGHHGPSRAGTSILDVRDPSRPRLVAQWPAPERTHTHKVQVADGLLLVNHERFPPGRAASEGPFSAGLAVYRLDDPFQPKQIGFWESGGQGVHRIVYTGGRYAHMSATPPGYADRIWMVVDLADPAAPREAGRWWWPGAFEGGGERRSWPEGDRYAAHHALVDGSRAYLGYGDANLVILDISDMSAPRRIGHLAWDGGSTHTCMPLPGRGLVVATDEQVLPGPDAPERLIRIIDVAGAGGPRVIGVCPPPDPSFRQLGLRFGPHNLHENRPASYRSERLIFATYFSAGVRVYDIADPEHPVEVASWVGAPPPGQPAAQANDLFVASDGLVYVTDRVGGGLHILEPEPALAALMRDAEL